MTRFRRLAGWEMAPLPDSAPPRASAGRPCPGRGGRDRRGGTVHTAAARGARRRPLPAQAQVIASHRCRRRRRHRRPPDRQTTTADARTIYQESWPMTTEPPTSAQPLWFIDNLVYIHVDGEQSGGAYSLSETWGAHGNMPLLHVHRRNDETFYVLEGDVRLFLGDREIVLARGQAALAPRDVPHSYRVESDRA